MKNHYGLGFPNSSISLEAVLELDACFPFTAAWDAFVDGPLCPDAEFLFATHGYVYEKPWGGGGTSESDDAAMTNHNGGSDQSDQDRYEGKDNEEGSEPGSRRIRRRESRVMTVADVHRAFVDANLIGSLADANNEVNPCLKKAVLLGHVVISDSTTLGTVLFEGKCIDCGETLLCTWQDAMEQPPRGENDCGEGAAVRCPGCETGNHITGLCEGKACYDSGKFHNHCVRCPDFGECIKDYRHTHCLHCDQHYFRGNSGFPCPNCGGGKCRDVAGMAPPPPSTWDGRIENIREVFDSKVAREQDPMKRALMKMMVLGPQANCDGSEVMGAMSAMMSMMANNQGRAEPGAEGSAGEGCPQM